MAEVNWKTPEQVEQERLDAWRENVVVSRFQARHALRLAGLRDQVEEMVNAPDADPLLVDAWNDAQEFRRNSQTIIMLSSALGLTDEQIDDLFRQAEAIEA